MCKYSFLNGQVANPYFMENLMDENEMVQEVIRATTNDFARSVEKLTRRPGNVYLCCHVFDLLQTMLNDDIFQMMNMDVESYIEMTLDSAGLDLSDICLVACRAKLMR